MKKVEVDRLVGKAILITVIICAIMIGMAVVQQAYFLKLGYDMLMAMPVIVIFLSVIFAIGAIACLIFGVFVNTKFYGYATGLAGLAILSMLLKINYEIRALEFIVNGINIKFFPLVLAILALMIMVNWVLTILKIVKN